MADLKKELDEYLLLNSEQKKSNVLNIPKFSKPDLRKLFNRDGDTTVKQSDPEISCCPTMVNKRVELYLFQRSIIIYYII